MKALALSLLLASHVFAQAIPIDNQWMLLTGAGSTPGFPGFQTAVGASGNVDVTNPPYTWGYSIDYWGLTPPVSDQGIFRNSAKPGGKPAYTVTLPSDNYCCTLYRPFAGNYTTPPTPTFPMQVGGTLTFNVTVAASSGATVESVGDTGYDPNGNPVNSCGGNVATLRPFIMGVTNPYFSYFIFDSWDLDNRWFSTDYAVIAGPDGVVLPGTYTISTTISTLWTGVYGDSAAGNVNFNQALASPGAIALGFGGLCFYDHGWEVTNGTVKVTLNTLSYVPAQ